LPSIQPGIHYAMLKEMMWIPCIV